MEKEMGITTSQIKKSGDKDNFHYQGASYWVLLKVLTLLPENLKNKGFVDYGCGKGRALFCAESIGFNRLIGLDLDSELIENAKLNERNYLKKRNNSTFEFHTKNALTFNIPDNCGTFYFFNPFSENIMKQVAEKIKTYAISTKQEVTIVYLNPQFKNCWIDNGFKIKQTVMTNRYTEAILFTYIP